MQKVIRAVALQPEIAALLAHWSARGAANVLDETIALQQIAAPTFEERARAEAVRQRFTIIGLDDVEQDDIGNVYGRTPGKGAGPAVLISAHLDTVFPADTDLTIRRDHEIGRVFGPGIGDNCVGLGALIQLAEQMTLQAVVPPVDIWWVATVGEEGLGDLRGIRRACERLGDHLGLALILEGIGLGRIYHAGMGVRRLKITVKGPGGHSWLHSDRPSAIHHLIRIGAAVIENVEPPKRPRSSLNIGLISGGTSINTLAPEATFSIDLRSVEGRALAAMESAINVLIEQSDQVPDLHTETEVVGDRPSASLPVSHPLVRAAEAVLRYVNAGPGSREIGSTDANIPLAQSIPAVCIGITTGGGAHTVDEYIDTGPIATGMSQLTLLAMLTAEHAAEWARWGAGTE